MWRPTSNSRVTGLPMTALVTSAVTLVTVLFSLFSMDSMLRPECSRGGMRGKSGQRIEHFRFKSEVSGSWSHGKKQLLRFVPSQLTLKQHKRINWTEGTWLEIYKSKSSSCWQRRIFRQSAPSNFQLRVNPGNRMSDTRTIRGNIVAISLGLFLHIKLAQKDVSSDILEDKGEQKAMLDSPSNYFLCWTLHTTSPPANICESRNLEKNERESAARMRKSALSCNSLASSCPTCSLVTDSIKAVRIHQYLTETHTHTSTFIIMPPNQLHVCHQAQT